MITRHFYKHGEVVERLGTDTETLRQAVVLGKVSVFLEFNRTTALWVCGDNTEVKKSDPYCSWLISSSPVRVDEHGAQIGSAEDPIPARLTGWFRVGANYARDAARSDLFGPKLGVAPSSVDPEFAPWNLWFVVPEYSAPFCARAWFLASEIDSLASGGSLNATKWPWGEHETQLLRDLAAAAKEHWSAYDPAKPTTAPKNEIVAEWLVRERRVSRRIADVIATLLRDDELRDGPRPRR